MLLPNWNDEMDTDEGLERTCASYADDTDRIVELERRGYLGGFTPRRLSERYIMPC